jgi:hypothetical protein
MIQDSLTPFLSDNTASTDTDGNEFEPWPDELPEELQMDHYPPISSNDPLVDEGPASNIRIGDVDCYRVRDGDSVKLFGFLILGVCQKRVYKYSIHTGSYGTCTIGCFTDHSEFDQSGNVERPERKIYQNVVEA